MASYAFVTSVLLFSLVLFIFCRVFLQLIRISKIPEGIPWAAVSSDSTFAKLRACFWEPFAKRKHIHDGYEKYGQHGLPFVLPALHWPGVVLPPSNAAWVASQPEAVLNHVKPFDDLTGFDYLAHGPNTESVHDFTVIRRNLTRQMRTLIPQSLDEIATTIDESLGHDCDNWKDVKIADIIQDVSFHAANRIFVGQDLCRNKKYRAAVEHWLLALGVILTFIRVMIPFPWRRWIAPALAAPANLLQYRVKRFVLPDVRRRLARFHAGNSGKGQEESENDMLQWIVETNATKGDPAELDPMHVAGKLLLLNMFAVNTTSAVASMLIMNLLSLPSAPALIAELQEEARRVMPRVSSDPKILHTMVKMDSTVRELLRYDPFLAQGMIREIMTPQGIITPDGLHLPQGCHVHTIVCSMQRDEGITERANEFDPLRHYRAGCETGRQRTAVQIDDKFLTFSLGRHACPGRFFAVHSLKLIIGYLLCNYDIESTTNTSDPFIEIGEGRVPSPKALIKCRRRQEMAS